MVVPGELGEELHAEFGGQFAGGGQFVFIVSEDNELPFEEREGGALAAFFVIEAADVGDDFVEGAFDAVLGVGVGRGAIDGERHRADAVANDGFESRVGGVVEVDAIVGVDDDVVGGGDGEKLGEAGVEQHFAVVGEFEFVDGGIGGEESGEMVGIQVASAEMLRHEAFGGGAGGAGELAVGGCVDLDEGRRCHDPSVATEGS